MTTDSTQHTGEKEPSCIAGVNHRWLACSFGGVGYIEKKICVNCGLVATRTPPIIEDDEVTKWSGFAYNKPFPLLGKNLTSRYASWII